MNLSNQVHHEKILRAVGEAAARAGHNCFAVGGFVRDLILRRPSKDIDFVTVGSGIELARAVAAGLGPKTRVNVFKTYGTAQIKRGELELEFVGARRESYRPDSRNPVVEDGTLDDDLSRRDFTINAMAMSVLPADFGEVIDKFHGLEDLKSRIIRTPLDPDITFSDDPLRMMRAVRFATQLGFEIHPETMAALQRNAPRIEIITRERIKDELFKIMASPRPSIGWLLLREAGLLHFILPELERLQGVEVRQGRGHKDNFYHTLKVLDTVAERSDNIWLRWAALFHDIAKPVTKFFDPERGWTFHNHNFIGARMLPGIFARMKFPQGEHLRYVSKLVELHMRPIALVEEEVTDSAVRRLANYAEEDLADLMILARADITSKDEAKKARFLANFDLVEEKIAAIRAKDAERNRKFPLNGTELMQLLGLPTGPEVGFYVKSLQQAIKDCEIDDTREASLEYVLRLAAQNGRSAAIDPQTLLKDSQEECI